MEQDGHDLAAEDYLAHLAGVVVEAFEIPISDAISERVGRGELTESEAMAAHGRSWYRYPVRSSADPVESGTSPAGVARAIDVASAGRVVAVPLSARLEDGSVQLTDDRWSGVLDELAAHVDDWQWHAVFNYESDQVLKPDDPAFTPANLAAAGAEARLPRDDWGVGHFAGLAGLWRMRSTGRWWMLLFDTYKHRGFDGYQPQPASLMRQALVRTDGRGGGVLLVVPAQTVQDVRRMLDRRGLVARMWSNGSPEPDDWAWTAPAEVSPRLPSAVQWQR